MRVCSKTMDSRDKAHVYLYLYVLETTNIVNEWATRDNMFKIKQKYV